MLFCAFLYSSPGLKSAHGIKVQRLTFVGSWLILPRMLCGKAKKRGARSLSALNGRVERVAVVTDVLCGQYQLFF